jgi:hypothetical protein
MTPPGEAAEAGPAVRVAVDDFYARVEAEPQLAPFFSDVDLRHLKAHQRAFIAAAIDSTGPVIPGPAVSRLSRPDRSPASPAPAAPPATAAAPTRPGPAAGGRAAAAPMDQRAA